MTVYFIKNDDLILFHFNMKKLNMFNFLHIKMMKISDTIVLSWRQRVIYLCFYVNIRFSKNRSNSQQNCNNVSEYWKK